MNYVAFIMYILYVSSAFVAGLFFTRLLSLRVSDYNRYLFLGETLLLGSVIIYGELMVLSMAHLYTAPFLWMAVLMNFSFLGNKDVRSQFHDFFSWKWKINLFHVGFMCLLLFFCFRNIFFLLDNDSLEAYLSTQKLWVMHGTSFVGDRGTILTTFNPCFDSIPFSLSLSVFLQETLFPAMIHMYWRIIVLLLVFGYTLYRFNAITALAASMAVLFNDHFFFSGVNLHVVVCYGVTFSCFACAYSFWESREKEDPRRFICGMIFACVMFLNKYQAAYLAVGLLLFGIAIQKNHVLLFKNIVRQRKLMAALLFTVLISSLLLIKNWIQTGDPVFPVFAGRLGVFNWSPEKETAFFGGLYRGIKISEFFKYMNFLFIWPGIHVGKILVLILSFFPFIIFFASGKAKVSEKDIKELSYWLALCVMCLFLLCFAFYQDVRYYRYLLALFVFSGVVGLDFIMRNLMKFPAFLRGILILILALKGFSFMFSSGTKFHYPSIQDNLNVLMNKKHTEDYLPIFHPETVEAREFINKHPEEYKRSAWAMGIFSGFPVQIFFVPYRPQLDPIRTSIVHWDSFKSKDKKRIIAEIRDYGIDWIIVKDKQLKELIFITPEEYAEKAVKFDTHFKKVAFDYGLVPELTQTYLKE